MRGQHSTLGRDHDATAADKPAASKPGQLLLHIDRPILRDGVALESVRGSLSIEGWALARDGVDSVEIAVDGIPLAKAKYGIRRPDIAEAFPGWDGAGGSGFALILPPIALTNGGHRISVKLRSRRGNVTASEFYAEVEPAPMAEGPTVLRRKMPLSEVQFAVNTLAALAWHPRFGLLLGVGEIDVEVEAARRTLASLRDQAYASWHVAIVRRGRTVPEGLAARLLDGFDDIAERVEVRLDATAATPLVALLATDAAGGRIDLIGTLLAGDLLSCDALLEMAINSGLNPEAELLYGDELRTDPGTGRRTTFFKPQWSPDLLTATNYVGRFWCAVPGVLGRARATFGEWFQFGEYDLILRCTETAWGIRRVAKLLCERGRLQLDHPDQERAALIRAMIRRNIPGDIHGGVVVGHYRWKRAVLATGMVSVIIPTCAARGLVKICIETIRTKTAYRNFEIVCIENIPEPRGDWIDWLGQHADKVVNVDEPFNWSRFNNLAAREARGEFLLFLNDDIEIIDAEWLDALLEHGQRPEVGVVGARLLYPDRKVQHAGIVWTAKGGRHAFRGTGEAEPGYFGLALTERNVTAVTGACMLMRRDEYDAQGGFNEKHSIINNDVDFCLRCWERGKHVVYTPYSTLVHHEEASRHQLGEGFDIASFNRRWGPKLRAGDGFYHPFLSHERDDYAVDPEPLELVYTGHPLFDRSEIRNILAVKLDHIGDFIAAVPAVRRLHALFPQARLHVLTAPATMAFARLLPEVAEFIEFEFFFARSGLGQRRLETEDFTALRQRLESYRFDLAIDLRKLPETRPVLRVTGGRWLAGFDHNRQFPWLDIVMEWEQDPATVKKRSQISEDLLRLIEAVGNAAEPNRAIFPAARPHQDLPSQFARRFQQPARGLVLLHPGAGTAIKQWPTPYYAELIDLLVAAHDVDVALIGSPDEAEIVDEVLSKVRRTAAIRSLVGEVALPDLPALLSEAALFVGNDSGPKHLAAALGIPTIGIHSGTVDAREWGPAGPLAVAMQRRMVCSPCYLSDSAQCLREVACLTELRPNDVYELCRRLLALQPGRPPRDLAESRHPA
jgi:ADP-heptose:LPS heptosyltransferase/GT2 family glycosyltransferase